MSNTDQVLMFIIIVLGYLGTPVALAWGWIRLKSIRESGVIPRIAQLSFCISTLSALLAAGTIICSLMIGGFAYYDPRLLRIYRIGIVMSLVALMLSLAGILRKSSIRWLALLASTSIISFWLVCAGSE